MRVGAVFGLAALCGFGGCAVGPDYRRAQSDVPPEWRAVPPWHEAQPDDAAGKGRWWLAFQDEPLDALVARALANNQDLRSAALHLEEARAQVTIARAALAPAVVMAADPSRSLSAANRPPASYGATNLSTTQNDFKLDGAVSYELDLFGRLRLRAEAAHANLQQATADVENARLVLVAQVASDYFSLRELDAESAVLAEGIESLRRSRDVIAARHELGFATGLDLAQQQSLLEASEAELALLQNQRAQFEHAIATLVDVPAPSFSLEPAPGVSSLPAVALGMPSDLLQRRPDVASAERAMAAANARVGIARAAYFPTIDLAAAIGWESGALSTLLQAPSRAWSIGAAATAPLFNAGAIGANVRIANAQYEEAVASYRHTVLVAMEEVENGIHGLSDLARAEDRSAASTASAERALDIADARYAGGVATFLDVFAAQQTALANRRQTVQVRGQRALETVYLIKALGGGWTGLQASR
jgi:NodT family efflux transporter outer membrane factor (OMF) lipoprotein